MSINLAEFAHGPFVLIAEAMPAMIWLGDSSGQCVYLNRTLREFWGVDVADIPRFSWATTLLPEDRDTLFGVIDAAMRDRVPFTITARYRRADGAVRLLETKAEPRFAPNGEFLGMVGVNTDVTESP